jgi:hypothetical protein
LLFKKGVSLCVFVRCKATRPVRGVGAALLVIR